MPCFSDGILWVELEEIDSFQVDKAQLAIACSGLETGENELIVSITEDGATVSTNPLKVDSILGATFSFGGSDAPGTA